MITLRRSFAVLAAALLVAEAAAQSVTGFQSRDLLRLRSVDDAQISPAGTHIAYTVTTRESPRGGSSRIWLYDLDTRQARPLLEGDGSSSEPRWSRDGKWLAFRGTVAGRAGLHVVRADGAAATLKFVAPLQGTNSPMPSTGDRISWSPDGRALAFVSAAAGPEPPAAGSDPVVITRYLYRPLPGDTTRFNDNRRLHIYSADLATGAVRQLTTGDYSEHSIDWSPAGDEILFLSNREADPDRVFNYDVFAVRVSDGTIRRLTATENVEYRPRWSPDGRRIAYQGTTRGLTSSETTMEDTHVWVMDADGANRRELGRAIDNRQGAPQWSADGQFVYFTVQTRGNVQLQRLPASGGAAQVVVGETGRVGSWSVAGETVAFAFSGLRDLAQLYVARGGAPPAQLTQLNQDVLAGKQIAPVEAFTFRSFDGLEVEAFLTRPLQQGAGAKHPMITVIHGGPHGQQGASFDFQSQVFASRGYAVLMVNYRGSTGYGQKFADAIFGDQNGGEAKDVLYGVEAALRRYPWLDADQLGVQGGSYGGQLSNWLVTQTNRFAAAIPIASISNLITQNYLSYYHDYLAVEFGSYPHQGQLMDKLWERSPLRYVANVRTPVMLVHGEQDTNVPVTEAEQFFIALKDVGVETVMVRYPREGHGIRETGHTIDLLDRSIAWYEKHFSKRRGKTTTE